MTDVFFAMVADASGNDQPAFFIRDRHAPEGAVKISAQRHADLVEALAEGKSVVAGKGGKPKIKPLRQDAATRRAELTAAIKREAAARIDQVAPIWRQLNDTRHPSEDGTRRFAQVDAIRAASDQLEWLMSDASAADLSDFPVQSHPLWPEFT